MKIIVLRGLPWSGKSTWCKSQDIPSISKDDIRQLLHNGVYSKKNEQDVLAYRDIFIVSKLLELKDVIVDDTNLNPVHIKTIGLIAQMYWAQLEIKDFTTDIETCIERDSKRENPVGEKVIRDMAKKWNYPPKKPEFEPIATFSDDKQDAVIFDIDWTLAKNVSRSPYDMTRVSEDEVYEDITMLVWLMSISHEIIFVSGRDDSCQSDTLVWLQNNVEFIGEANLVMRKTWDIRKDSIIKYEIAKQLNNEYNIRYVFDDRNQVVKMWREAGFRCLQVQDGNF